MSHPTRPLTRVRTALLAMIVALATVLAVPAAGQGDQELRVPDDVLAGIDANKVPAI